MSEKQPTHINFSQNGQELKSQMKFDFVSSNQPETPIPNYSQEIQYRLKNK